MRYRRSAILDGAGKIVEERQVTDLHDLAGILQRADYCDWLQGLGTPNSHYAISLWKEMGKFLETLTPMEVTR